MDCIKLAEDYSRLLEAKDKEIQRLKEEINRLTKYIDQLLKSEEKLTHEISRLKRGYFSDAELQNLCHTFSQEDCRLFVNGCVEYWIQLFGGIAKCLQAIHTRIGEKVNTMTEEERSQLPPEVKKLINIYYNTTPVNAPDR